MKSDIHWYAAEMYRRLCDFGDERLSISSQSVFQAKRDHNKLKLNVTIELSFRRRRRRRQPRRSQELVLIRIRYRRSSVHVVT